MTMVPQGSRGYPSTSTPRYPESFELKNPSDKLSRSARPKTLGSSFVEVISSTENNLSSIQIPEIGSYISLDDIAIAPLSDIHLSQMSQANNDVIINFEDGSLTHMENILITPAPETPEVLVDEDLFKKHLKFPDVITKTQGTRTSSPFPSAITSKAWQQYFEKKEKAKKDKENQIKKRKLERELKKKVQPQKKRMKKEKAEETKGQIKCGFCDFDLISDTEEEGEMNIGRDKCIRWYHLKCTKLKNLSYSQAAIVPYECSICQNVRKDVLKNYNTD
ncbi:unnamed protein product [Diatraea saccharalis]|uniref:PHD-type domain-containing protein n=1 Tax=Diatraea saccharalis TaxID=40085 RepID=A0A9N9QPM1_9NEOP|nr:unnamed protein product [Diatraea saccharalis]